jgi:quinohemoprotein ethanol dehydrogenase
MGNLMFIPPGQEKPVAPRNFMNPAAALIFTSDLEAAAATLPPPMQAAVKALPQWQQVLDKPFSSELRAIDPLTGETKWAAPFDGWQDRGGVLATESGWSSTARSPAS